MTFGNIQDGDLVEACTLCVVIANAMQCIISHVSSQSTLNIDLFQFGVGVACTTTTSPNVAFY